MSFLRHRNVWKVKGAVFAVLSASTCTLIIGCGSTQEPYSDQTLVQNTYHVEPTKSADVLSKGSVFMKRKTVYVHPPKEE